MRKNILIVVTSNNTMGQSGKPTGLWAEEFAVPYYAFIDAGHNVSIASPKGGQAPFDPASVKPIGSNHVSVDRLLSDSEAMAKLNNTHTAASVKAANFDAIFFPGGHGTMWDLPNDAGVTQLVTEGFAEEKVMAAVCHGVAAFVSAKRADGESVVSGRRINSFTDAEETAAGLMGVVPFALESKLRSLGGQFEGATNWQPFVIQDGNLITGQNPQSSLLVSKHILDALAVESSASLARV